MAPIIDNNSNACSMDEELEAEAVVLKQIQNKLSEKMAMMAPPTEEELKAIDAKSVFIGNVEYGATIEELQEHFKGCGEIVRTTIPKDKMTQRQRNFAYIEFESSGSVENAILMNGSTFRGRPIVVTAKRTNKPGMGASRGRGGRGGFRGGRGGSQTVVVKYVYVNGPAPRGHGGFRGGRGRFNPY